LSQSSHSLLKDLLAGVGWVVAVGVQREINATDDAIDRLVYELYRLTEDEIRIVEGT